MLNIKKSWKPSNPTKQFRACSYEVGYPTQVGYLTEVRSLRYCDLYVKTKLRSYEKWDIPPRSDLTAVLVRSHFGGMKIPIWTNSSEPAHLSGMNLSIIRRRESNKQWKSVPLNGAIKFEWLSGSPCRAEIHHMNTSWKSSHLSEISHLIWTGPNNVWLSRIRLYEVICPFI